MKIQIPEIWKIGNLSPSWGVKNLIVGRHLALGEWNDEIRPEAAGSRIKDGQNFKL
jgi:hypothetical protein